MKCIKIYDNIYLLVWTVKQISETEGVLYRMDGFSGGFGGVQTPPPQGRVNTPPPENVETPPKKFGNPPENLLIFNIPNYSLDYFTTMKLF